MAAQGLNKISVKDWSNKDRKKLKKYISYRSSDWKKKTLSWARIKIKSNGLALQSFRCAYCRMMIADRIGMVEIDHVISKNHAPRFTYYRGNLVLTCKRCNNQKGNKNPTVYSLAELSSRKRYPLNPDDYVWVHPYLHDYDEHIEISDGYVFSSKSGSPNGYALIKGCGLDKLSFVSKRQRMASVLSASNEVQAVLAVVGASPMISSGDLVEDISKRSDISISKADLLELIDGLRRASLKDFLDAMRKL